MTSGDTGNVPAQSVAAAQAGGARRPQDEAQAVGLAGGMGAQATMGVGRHEGPISILPAFDNYHAPTLKLVDDCVHCGFCLPTCPTYLLFGEEMDSPRGRIYLMREGIEGEAMTPTMVRHWDLCLGCLACVTACPSGVQYDKLIEATRSQVERRHPRSLQDRLFRELIYGLFPYPWKLRLLMAPLALYEKTGARTLARKSGLLDRLPPRLRALESLAPPVPTEGDASDWTPAQGEERCRVGLLRGCVQRAFFPGVNAATARVLSAEGCGVAAPRNQSCCGALSLHGGREEEGMRFARRTIDTFEAARVETVVANVAGCGSAMKEYGYLLRDDPTYRDRAMRFSERVRDVSELIDELGPSAERLPLPITVVYHDACHLAHGQKITAPPRRVLEGIPGLTIREVPREREICCGSAGTYNLLEPEAARELGTRKAEAVWDAGADLLVTANPGCHLQISASLRRLGQHLPSAHVVEVLDASLRGVSPEMLTERR